MSEIIEALDALEKDKGINREIIMEAIEKSIVSACAADYGKNVHAEAHMDRETGEIKTYIYKKTVETVIDSKSEISLEEARKINMDAEIGDEVRIQINSKDFGRSAAQNAKNIILQSIRESERKALYNYFKVKEHDVITGIVERYIDDRLIVNLDGRTKTILEQKEMIPNEHYNPGDRIKLYIVDVRETRKNRDDKKSRGSDCRILTSRTHPELVKRLFEREVAEISDGTVEIKSISREAGSRSKIAVHSNNENVDAVGSCVGMNGNRVNSIVDDLCGEKMDIIEWNENPAIFIENALRPSKVISVKVDEEDRSARVVVPDYQLSLAIGKEGQNARLAAKLTGFKIDIKSESQQHELESAASDDEIIDVDDTDNDFISNVSGNEE